MASGFGRPNEGTSASRLYIGNVDEKTTLAVLWELMLQAGPVDNVNLPKNQVSQKHRGFGFADFQNEEDSEYAVQIFNGIKLFGKPIRVNKASSNESGSVKIGAELHVSGLSPSVDIKTLVDTFFEFGTLLSLPKVYSSSNSKRGANGQMRKPEHGEKVYAIVSFTDFNASDRALEALNGQYLGGRPITVSYALKKDGKKGERHGSDAERRLAALGQKNNVLVQPLLPPVLPPGFAQAAFPVIGATGVASALASEPQPFPPQYAPPGVCDNGQFFTNLAPPPGILVLPGGFNLY
jgi:splicing factor 3B subunit 4